MKEPLRKVLRDVLDEISDQKFADLVFRLFTSMPDEFYTNLAYERNPIPLAEHLVLTAVLVLRKIKKKSARKSRRLIQRITDEAVVVCLFHDFWKFDWTNNPSKRIKGDHGYVSGDKMSEFIKESNFPKKSKNRIVGSIFYHMTAGHRKAIVIENIPRFTKATRLLTGSDGQTYKIYQSTKLFSQSSEVIKCIQDYK